MKLIFRVVIEADDQQELESAADALARSAADIGNSYEVSVLVAETAVEG